MADVSVPEVKVATQAAAEWLEAYAIENKIDLDSLSGGEWFIISTQVPCAIRCWRVGVSIEVEPNQECPECGKVNVVSPWVSLGSKLLEPDKF